MGRRSWAWAIAALLGLVSPVQGQTALDRLEDRLRDRENAEELPPPDAAAAPGYLGAITDDRQDRGRGVRIVEVVAGGPAAEAGLADGDLIVEVENQPVRRMADLAAAIETAAAGDRLTLSVLRDGEAQAIAVTLGRRPAPAARRFDEFGRVPEEGEAADAPPDGPGGRVAPPPPAPAGEAAPPKPPRLGITTRAVSAEARRLLDLPNNRGALVTEVVVGSPAHRAGIPLQSMIVSIGGLVVRNPNELGEALTLVELGDEIEVAYYRGPTLHKVTLTLDDEPVDDGPIEEPAAAPPEAGPGPRDIERQNVENPAGEEDDRVRALERRVEELERRIEELELSLQDSRA